MKTMEEDLHKRCLAQNTLPLGEFNAFIQERLTAARVAAGGNVHFVDPDIKPHTMARAREHLKASVVASGGVVTSARAEAARNWQAAFANLAALSVFKDKIFPECWFNSDMLSVGVGDKFDAIVKLLAPQRSINLMHARNLRVATTHDGTAFRGMNLMGTHSLAGELVHFATIVKDEAIEAYEVIQISEDFTNWLVPKDWDKQEFFRHYQQQCVIPGAQRVRERLLRFSSIEDARVKLHAHGEIPAVVAAPVPVDYKKTAVLSTSDGEWQQFEALFDPRILEQLEQENIMVLKHSASASPTQNTADAGSMHSNMHRELATWGHRMRKPGAPTTRMKDFIEYFKSKKNS